MKNRVQKLITILGVKERLPVKTELPDFYGYLAEVSSILRVHTDETSERSLNPCQRREVTNGQRSKRNR